MSFYRKKTTKDGRSGVCKPCKIKQVTLARKKPHRKDAERLRDRVYSHARRAKARLRPTTLTELDRFVLKEAASLAADREKTTGIKWHIDHIMPLNHKIISGLNCANNIQVVPAYWNMAKGNRNCNEFIQST